MKPTPPSMAGYPENSFKKRLLLWRQRQLARRDWRARFAAAYVRNPDLCRSCSPDVERAHQGFWRPLLRRAMPDTLRVCSGLSGHADDRVIPEELFVSEIAPRLNAVPMAEFQAAKNVYHRWYGPNLFPPVLLEARDGIVFDQQGARLTRDQADGGLKELHYPVVAKTSLGKGGASGVSVIHNDHALSAWIKKHRNWVVQPLLRQHDVMQALSPDDAQGLNTVRVCVYRSVRTETWVWLNAAVRIGRSGTFDNDAAGGVCCALSDTGKLHNYGCDKYASRFMRHPDSGVVFADLPALPAWQQLKKIALDTAERTAWVRLISFDFYLNTEGVWQPIEVNLKGHSIRFEQYAGRPFFGDYTEDVRNFCAERAGSD